ncbi:hypothetical protein BC835DRAFT_620059 [Cytidiella melzeri]|nr:hypothetical protein BC835DRAFT_620059 [Cytidiella melzeri]
MALLNNSPVSSSIVWRFSSFGLPPISRSEYPHTLETVQLAWIYDLFGPSIFRHFDNGVCMLGSAKTKNSDSKPTPHFSHQHVDFLWHDYVHIDKLSGRSDTHRSRYRISGTNYQLESTISSPGSVATQHLHLGRTCLTCTEADVQLAVSAAKFQRSHTQQDGI